MKFCIFSIPVYHATNEEEELNNFCSSHQVISIEKNLVADGQNSCWTFCVNWQDGEAALPQSKHKNRIKVDYREVLNDADFALYAGLRELRKTLAESEKIPLYAIFTNEQLATMVTAKVTTQVGLQQIPGIGTTRLEKYGNNFLKELNELQKNSTV